MRHGEFSRTTESGLVVPVSADEVADKEMEAICQRVIRICNSVCGPSEKSTTYIQALAPRVFDALLVEFQNRPEHSR